MACDRVKEFLSQRGETFDIRLVDEDAAAYDELLALGFRSVPVTVIGGTAVQGFDVAALLKALAGGG
jgi:adenosylhomocysteine nucleosidase